jgi:hypothetical protein
MIVLAAELLLKAFKIEAAEETGDGGLKLGAMPDWQGVTGWHGPLLGSRTVDPINGPARRSEPGCKLISHDRPHPAISGCRY